MDLRTNKVYNLIANNEISIYEEAHNFYLQKPFNKDQIETIVSSILKQSMPIQDILDALFLIGVLPNSKKTYFLGYLFYAIPLPPFWYITYEINKNKLYYNYKVVHRNLELPPFYQYLEYLKYYYDDIEDEINVNIPYEIINEEYLSFYQYKENEYSFNPLVKYKRLEFDFLKKQANTSSIFKLGQINENEFKSVVDDVNSNITKTRIKQHKNQKDACIINEKIQSLIQRNKRVSSAITTYNKTQNQLFKIKTNFRDLSGRPTDIIFDELEEDIIHTVNTKLYNSKNQDIKNVYNNNYFKDSYNIDTNKNNYGYNNKNKEKNINNSKIQSYNELYDNSKKLKKQMNTGEIINNNTKADGFLDPVLKIKTDKDRKRLRPITAFQVSKLRKPQNSAVVKPIDSQIFQEKESLSKINEVNKENLQNHNNVTLNRKSILTRPVSEFALKKNVKDQYENKLVRCKSVLECEKDKVEELQSYFSSNKLNFTENKLKKALTIPDMYNQYNEGKCIAKIGSGLLKFVIPKKMKKKKKKVK